MMLHLVHQDREANWQPFYNRSLRREAGLHFQIPLCVLRWVLRRGIPRSSLATPADGLTRTGTSWAFGAAGMLTILAMRSAHFRFLLVSGPAGREVHMFKIQQQKQQRMGIPPRDTPTPASQE
ncbi:MAG: hypothetical protein A3A26_03360 [Candidatus Zambryskibacteria bacterium RIFCSPLOWO2_01_FULL_47_14]|uniref:Uncharacterized protein n=1 Tax=Candidatus Zambryskibacteria bacterium RIFCSPLOWO2_01_FULL_47_14 TaxID=1802763 RepID=A0A1G2U8M2_9BACT|nr:MAG: hypothetical protein A3A26_03360 [Candidatus Zambryskibacteria bacterium RIFCSPLOWO2_01_FULL_47_14]